MRSFEDKKLYKLKEVSAALKEVGIPHNKYSIKKYAKNGKLKLGRLPRTNKMVFLGSEIKRFIKKFYEEIGAA